MKTTILKNSIPHLLLMIGLVALFQTSCSTTGPDQALYNSKDFKGWRQPIGEWTAVQSITLDAAHPEKFVVRPGEGVYFNGAKGSTVDLTTAAEFEDLEAHIEFCIPKNSNSGVYFMGQYELQIYDSYGIGKHDHAGQECGGIYGRWINNVNVEGHTPRVNVSKPPGEWQSFDVIFRAPRFDASGRKVANARFVKVVHNGTVVHENVDLNGPTRGSLWEEDMPTGPIRLQGEHGEVAYRNFRFKPVHLE